MTQRMLKCALGGVVTLFVSALAVLSVPAQAFPPPGGDDDFEIGQKIFQFNLIGHPGNYNGNCGQGHRIFVDQDANHGHIIVRHEPDGWHIEDCNATGNHKGELHAQDTGTFAAYARILGQPGGNLEICSDLLEDHTGTCSDDSNNAGEDCIDDSDCTGGGVCDLPENAHMCLVGFINLHREGGKSNWHVATDLFDDEYQDVIWNVTTQNFKLAQFRIYEVIEN